MLPVLASIILVFTCRFHEIHAVPYRTRSEYEVTDYNNYYDANESQQNDYEPNISFLDKNHEKLNNKSQRQYNHHKYKNIEDSNENDIVQINYNYNENKYGILNSNKNDKQSESITDSYNDSIQSNIKVQKKPKNIQEFLAFEKEAKYNDHLIMDPIILKDKSSFLLKNERSQYHNAVDVEESEKREQKKICTNGPAQNNEYYSQSFRQKNSSVEVADNFQISGNPILKIMSSVHDSEDITLCWIETTTIKEDKKAKPIKRQVFREFTISFENSAPIPDEYLNCTKLEGEILPGKIDALKNTSFNEFIEKDTKMSKVVNLTTQNYDENLFVTEYKIIRCSSGTSVTKDISEWVNNTKYKKKRVEIKVGPLKRILEPEKHLDVNRVAKNLNTVENSHIKSQDLINCTDNKNCDKKNSNMNMLLCTGVSCEQQRLTFDASKAKISTEPDTIDVSATKSHSNFLNISTSILHESDKQDGLLPEIVEKFSTSTLSTLNLETGILGPSCVRGNCILNTTKPQVQNLNNNKECLQSSNCYFASKNIGQQTNNIDNSSSASISKDCEDSFELCNSLEFLDNSFEIPSLSDGQRLTYKENGVHINTKNENYNKFEKKMNFVPILPSYDGVNSSQAFSKEDFNISIMSSTDIITNGIDFTTQFVTNVNKSKLNIIDIESKPLHKQPSKNNTSKEENDIKKNKTFISVEKNSICSDTKNCKKSGDFNNGILSNDTIESVLADGDSSIKSKMNNISSNLAYNKKFYTPNTECNVTDSQSDESNCMKKYQFNENLSYFSKSDSDHGFNDSTTDFISSIDIETIPYKFNIKDIKNTLPALDVQLTQYRKPRKPRLALKIKLLLEQINGDRKKKPLVQLEKKITIKDNLNDDENENLLSKIRAFNKSTDDLQSIKELLNCTVLENLTSISFNVNNNIQTEIVTPEQVDSFEDIIYNNTQGKIENYRKKKRNIETYVDKNKNMSFQIGNIKKCLPEIQNDLKTGLNVILSKISNNLNASRHDKYNKSAQHGIKPSETVTTISKNENETVYSRDKRSAQDLKNILEWSNERIQKSADGTQLRSVTELTAFESFEEMSEDAE